MQRTKDEIMSDFIKLSCALSPENLHCDGEASPQQVQNKLKSIDQSWKNLEKEIGYSVEEDDVWKYSSEKRKAQKLINESSPATVENTTIQTLNNTPTTQKKKNFFG